jgi:CAAX prenyl protease-like protein
MAIFSSFHSRFNGQLRPAVRALATRILYFPRPWKQTTPFYLGHFLIISDDSKPMLLKRNLLRASPIHARMGPYAVLLVLTVLQDSTTQGTFRFWMYFVKMLIGLWCIWDVRDLVPEARWKLSWEAVLVGILVCALWVGLDPFYPKFNLLFKGDTEPWNPFKQLGQHSALAWFFVAIRIFGSALIVPPIEEAFYRSFLYRYFVRTDFEAMPFRQFHWLSWVVTSCIFGFSHYQWLGGILCGLLYQGLVIHKNRLGDAMTAHGITNFLLGVWIVWQNDWKFW